jgi:hypothetical protein
MVKPVLKGILRVQNIFPLKAGFRLIRVYYDSPLSLVRTIEELLECKVAASV